jgi:hypothetical protein
VPVLVRSSSAARLNWSSALVERRLGGIALARPSGRPRLVGLGLDGEDDLAFLDLVAVGELARAEEALHAGRRSTLSTAARGR